MIPAFFRTSADRRKLFATMEFLSEHDPAGPITKGAAQDREVQKAAIDRRRTILEYKFADWMAAYFRYERAYVTNAVEASGRSGVEERVNLALGNMAEDLREAYEAAWRDAAQSWAEWADDKAGRIAKANDWGAPIGGWLRRNAGRNVQGISETTRKRVAAAVAEGMDRGESVARIARRIDRLYLEEIIPDRSMVIARTEVGSATNWSQDYVAHSVDVPMEKEWLSLSDDRTRDDHREANGQVQPLDEPFVVGGDELMFPGDDSLGAGPEQTIQCRCTVLHSVVEEQPRHKSAKAPSPAEFARDVLSIDNPDVATALAFMKGVFTDADEWTHARGVLMKHVSRMRRSDTSRRRA